MTSKIELEKQIANALHLTHVSLGTKPSRKCRVCNTRRIFRKGLCYIHLRSYLIERRKYDMIREYTVNDWSRERGDN